MLQPEVSHNLVIDYGQSPNGQCPPEKYVLTECSACGLSYLSESAFNARAEFLSVYGAKCGEKFSTHSIKQVVELDGAVPASILTLVSPVGDL